MIFFTTTTTLETCSLNLASNQVNVFASRATIDEATRAAVGTTLTSPDNLGIDAAGNIYIVEDQPGGTADIWFARDTGNDGVADSLGRWASLSTIGAEPTGLYFDKFNANAAPGLLHSVLRGAVTNLLNLLVFFILLIFFAVFLPGFFTNFLLFVLFLFFL